MRVLLDTNVWRYLVDAGLENNLFQVSRRSHLTISIAPAIIVETLRMSDIPTRIKIIELQTRDCWNRLMSDAFLQCEDVKREMVRTHPEWELQSKNITLFRKLRYDWIRTKGGFWEKVRNNPNKVAEQYKRQDSAALTEVRQYSREDRKSVFEKNRPMVNTSSLIDWKGSWVNPISGEKVIADAWRVYAETIWSNMLCSETAFQQWLGCDLDINFLMSYGSSEYMRFWRSEVSAEAVPREWIRAAVHGLQSERKVTDGNPTDSAIATHAVDVDLIISADKNFITMLNRIHNEAPFRTAQGYLIRSGKEGIEDLFNLLSNPSLVSS